MKLNRPPEVTEIVEAIKKAKKALNIVKSLPFKEGHLHGYTKATQEHLGDAIGEMKSLIGQLVIEEYE